MWISSRSGCSGRASRLHLALMAAEAVTVLSYLLPPPLLLLMSPLSFRLLVVPQRCPLSVVLPLPLSRWTSTLLQVPLPSQRQAALVAAAALVPLAVPLRPSYNRAEAELGRGGASSLEFRTLAMLFHQTTVDPSHKRTPSPSIHAHKWPQLPLAGWSVTLSPRPAASWLEVCLPTPCQERASLRHPPHPHLHQARAAADDQRRHLLLIL